MPSVSEILSSSARTRTLELLFAQQIDHRSIGIHLRLVASLSGRPVRSVELALTSLSKEGLVRKKKIDGKKEFFIQTKHKNYKLFAEIFRAAKNISIAEVDERLDKRASNFITFLNTTTQMINVAKKRNC